MNITPENKIKILEYKLAFEQAIQVKKEFEEGNSDLNYRLSFFRNKLIENNRVSKEQISNFDDIFMPKNKDVALASKSCDIDDQESNQNEFRKNNNIESWLKKAYRQIAKITHPDMLIGLKSEKLVKKFSNYYSIAQNAYEKNISPDIIMVANDLDISINNSIIEKEIKKPLEEKLNHINHIKNKIGYQWYYVPEANKDVELKKILTIMGFKFTEDDVKKAVNSKRPIRKAGTRPKKINVKRKKLN
jgi:hypothetical protein